MQEDIIDGHLIVTINDSAYDARLGCHIAHKSGKVGTVIRITRFDNGQEFFNVFNGRSSVYMMLDVEECQFLN